MNEDNPYRWDTGFNYWWDAVSNALTAGAWVAFITVGAFAIFVA